MALARQGPKGKAKAEMIEYLAPNGAAWNSYTGCLHGKDICATSETCWARNMSRRFKAICGGDFQPRFHLSRIETPLAWSKPRRIAVSFMGDLWGGWTEVDAIGSLGGSLNYEGWTMERVRRVILDVVKTQKRHTFLFLTKNPAEYVKWNPWPENAWVGCSITGAESPERQAAMLEALAAVQGAGVRWLNYEPALGPLGLPIPYWMDWVVVGAQTGRGAKPFRSSWRYKHELWAVCGLLKSPRPLWEKRNLARYLKRPPMQELPA